MISFPDASTDLLKRLTTRREYNGIRWPSRPFSSFVIDFDKLARTLLYVSLSCIIFEAVGSVRGLSVVLYSIHIKQHLGTYITTSALPAHAQNTACECDVDKKNMCIGIDVVADDYTAAAGTTGGGDGGGDCNNDGRQTGQSEMRLKEIELRKALTSEPRPSPLSSRKFDNNVAHNNNNAAAARDGDPEPSSDLTELAQDIVKRLYGFPFDDSSCLRLFRSPTLFDIRKMRSGWDTNKKDFHTGSGSQCVPDKTTYEARDPITTKATAWVNRIHKRYLEVGDVGPGNVWAVKSPMGSGKTKVFSDICANFGRILVVSCRRSYSDFLCASLPEFQNYQAVRGHINPTDHPKIVIQVQSLRRIRGITKGIFVLAQWDLLYIYEPDGVFKEIISPLGDREERKTQTQALITLVSCVPWHLRLLRTHLLSNLPHKIMSCTINDNVPRTHEVRVYESCALTRSYMDLDFVKVGIRKALGEEECGPVNVDDVLLGKHSSASTDLFAKWP
ncbi:hypothetical protein EGW08_023670 [Elysia chlorotica]|uniref:Replication origin-binding protein domain-containing protein n=1 Tax=Elysia chlorotica TaxID=188477 RepID=A0A433SIL7_ELYCH|nr:hypothetical protein EGW08_023670 [Elysia chlorotica]